MGKGASLMARTKSTPIEPVTQVKKNAPETATEAGGQSGDLQGLSDREESDNESVRELIEEGQFYEASVVEGVEDAPPADAGPIRIRQRTEDDLRPEYEDQDPDQPKE
jgi:hypothetical protein